MNKDYESSEMHTKLVTLVDKLKEEEVLKKTAVQFDWRYEEHPDVTFKLTVTQDKGEVLH
jgi:hypothetical protein